MQDRGAWIYCNLLGQLIGGLEKSNLSVPHVGPQHNIAFSVTMHAGVTFSDYASEFPMRCNRRRSIVLHLATVPHSS